MTTKLPVQLGGSYIAKKLWNLHQNNEYTRVDRYKEGLCFLCFSRGAAAASIIDICTYCMDKKGYEPILAKINNKFYAMCNVCGNYKFKIYQINVRLCMSCTSRIKDRIRDYNKKGGPTGADPFWRSIKRKMGKDHSILFNSPGKSIRI